MNHSFLVNKISKGKCEGRTLEVLGEPPLERKAPSCVHFGICGGCAYQNLDYEQQLALKEAQIRELLAPVLSDGGKDFDALFEGIKKSPRQSGYRNKMEFSFGDTKKDGPLALGMHKKGSFYDIVNVDHCQIMDEDYRRILICVRNFFEEKKISYYHKKRHKGYLRHLLVRKAAKTGEILIDIVTSTQAEGFDEKPLLEEMTENIRKLGLDGKIAGILHTKNDSLADAVRDDGTDILYGQDYFYEELLGFAFKITQFSFFQTNSLGAEVLYETAREYIGDSLGTVFDLYSGTGTIAQMLAPAAKKAVGVEIVEEAVKAARENAAKNGLSNCEFIAGDVLHVIDTLTEKPDVIVLDPPREGIHPKAIKKIGMDMGARRMVYISCKPASLARDLAVLQGYGYEVERMCCVDMFPFTGNIETVVCLGREFDKSKEHVCLDYEPSPDIEVTCAATYAEIKEWVMKEYGLKVSSLYVAQVKQKHGIIERENYNKPKAEGGKVPHCPPEKEAAIEAALRYFRMI